jgi:beta-galactosidase
MIGGVGWYRKAFHLPDNLEGKRVEITFDGVYQNSTVWINGHKLGTRPFGYITFKYDLTPFLNNEKENVIAVRVDNSDQPNSRWYSGSGIYRNVWLTITDKLHMDPWGLFVTTPKIDDNLAKIKIESRINNYRDGAEGIIILTEIFSPGGKMVGQAISDLRIHPGTSARFEQEIDLADPVLWSVAHPGLYILRQTILKNGNKIDDYQTTFGIRSFRFDPDLGFFLNGESMKIKGVCMHHDLGALGAAVNTRAMERQLEIMKDMGVNAIRTAHNPPAPELLHLCDRMGFLVMNETFDEWKLPKTRYGYSVFWDEWHERDLRDHIMRDRNHPSVIMWSIGNEILEQWHPQGTEMAFKLASIVRELDPTRPITAGNNEPTPGNSLIKSGMLDLIGYNYKHETFKNFPGMFPGKSFIAAETTSALATRGSYDMPSDSIRRWPYRWDVKFTDGNEDHTCSAYDNCSAPWGSTHAETWKEIKKNDFLSGMFIWTGFDYLGEPTPYEWPSRSSYFGVVDLAGFPKDAYYMYKSEWTDETVLHVFPHWNWEAGQVVDVWAYYNKADEVELYLNDVSIGKRSKTDEDLHVFWRVPFEKGTLKAVSRFRGEIVKEKEIHTAGTPAKMKIVADRTRLQKGGEDLAFITIDIMDSIGTLVPFADTPVRITIEGDATIAGVDNGNQTSHHDFQGNTINAFHGKCLAIIRAGKSAGTVKVTFESDGLPAETLVLTMN